MNLKSAIVLVLAAMFAFCALAAPRRESAGVAPPPVVSRSVSVNRGESIVVPLEIHGARGESLEFLIRAGPSYGRLSKIVSRGANGAAVKYTAPSRAGVMVDRFTFAVRGSEGVSAPGVVSITIVDPPALPANLVLPRELEFPSIFVGQRGTAELELVNEGGTAVTGQVTVNAPWRIEGPKEYNVPARQRIAIKIVFTPEAPGPYSGEAIVGGVPRRVVELRGVAEERLGVMPPRLVLAAAAGSQTRTGALNFSNRSDEDARVTVTVGARILAGATVIVPRRGKAELPVFAEADEVSAFDDVIKLTSERWTATIPVHVAALGPLLRFGNKEVAFGRILSGQSGEVTVIVENTGGEAATAQLEIPKPFELGSESVSVPAKGRAEVTLRLDGKEPGIYDVLLKASAHGREIKVDVHAEVVEAPKPAKPVKPVTAPPAPPGEPPEPPKDPEPPEAAAPIVENQREHPNAIGNFGWATSARTAVIDWPANIGGTNEIHFDERDLLLSADGEIQINWVPVVDALVQRNGDRMQAELPSLAPGTLHTIRVRAGRGDSAKTLFTVQFRSPAREPLITVNWTEVLALIAVALSGVAAFKRWKNRKLWKW